ncbi:chaplin family protein [Streptomyces polygonati]|uniref:Chaplin family protein n=1 Tax=Streptomyces polygonati TaxID=1617087 RepID=A0ABV8HN57_9ACTN
MSVETRSSGGGAAKAGVRRAAVLGAVAGAALLPTGAAHASVIGVGNAMFGNACVNQDDGARSSGATVAGSGVGGGNQAGLPLSLPRNHCGSSGIVCTALFRSSV